jgi:hypothetical protein
MNRGKCVMRDEGCRMWDVGCGLWVVGFYRGLDSLIMKHNQNETRNLKPESLTPKSTL